MKPTEIRKIEDKWLEIKWADGLVYRLGGDTLRTNCPCATCKFDRGEDSHSTPLTPKKPSSLRIVSHTAQESNSISNIWAIGQYALGIGFADNHDSGIFTFNLLRDLATTSGEKICTTTGQKCGGCGC